MTMTTTPERSHGGSPWERAGVACRDGGGNATGKRALARNPSFHRRENPRRLWDSGKRRRGGGRGQKVGGIVGMP